MSSLTQNPDDRLLEQLLVAAFVSRRDDGVFIDVARLRDTQEFESFADRLFGAEVRFAGLDYPLFLKLAFDTDALAEMKRAPREVRLASQIVPFPPQRKALYRPVKVLERGARAEYVFEPVMLEVSYEEPVYGEPDENGVAQILEYVTKTKDIPARLDFDEFVADMWTKGVHFGLDEAAVRGAIADGKPVRMTIALQLDPTEGRDAEIMEASPDLHRDNSPKIMANGKADLRMFKNRFPQMAQGARLLKKIPRVLGKQGRKVGGEAIEPKLPKDLELFALSGPGTRIEQFADGEYIVATLQGFLSLDPKNNTVSVTEKIENKGGISVKTTGDLSLSVDEFVEHGEVQEGREVKGRHMTFMSDVFGRVISEGGNLRMRKNLSGGVAETLSGDIELNGRVSRSLVRTRDGEVKAGVCESSTLVGRRVQVEQAINCEIIAEEIEAGSIEGCMLAAKRIHIGSADERRGRENLVTLLIPDLSGYDRYIAKLQKDIADARSVIGDKTRQIEMIKSDAELAKFLALAQRIRSGAIKLTPEQEVNWRKLSERHAKDLSRASQIEAELAQTTESLKQAEEELAFTEHDRAASSEGIACAIDRVLGQTSGQTMRSPDGAASLSALSPEKIRDALQKSDAGKERIFCGDSGAIEWKFKAPQRRED